MDECKANINDVSRAGLSLILSCTGLNVKNIKLVHVTDVKLQRVKHWIWVPGRI